MAFQGTLVLDVRCECNRDVWFTPLQRALKGEDRSDQLHTDRPNGLLVQLGVLPGERLTVDFKNRVCKAVHKLDLPENKELSKRVRAMANSEYAQYQKFGRFSREENEEHKFLEEDVPTWLFHIRQLVDHGRMEVVSGSLPSMAEIRKMGRIFMGEAYGAKIDKDNPYGIKNLNWLEPVVDGKDLALAK